MKYGLNYFTDIHLTIFALLLFFFWFLLLCFWVYRVTPKEQHDRMSKLPLEELSGECGGPNHG